MRFYECEMGPPLHLSLYLPSTPGVVPCHHWHPVSMPGGGFYIFGIRGRPRGAPSLCSLTLSSLPLSAPFRPWFRTAPNDLAHRYLPLPHACSPHSLLLCVCIGFWVDTNYRRIHFNACGRRGTPSLHPLPFTWFRACPTPPSTPLRPFHRSRLAAMPLSHVVYPCTLPRTRVHCPYSPAPPNLTPAVCTHAPRTSPTTFHAVFHPPTHPPLR